MKVIKLPSLFAGVKSRKDKSYRLEFDTRELGGNDASLLLDMHMTEVYLMVAADEQALSEADIPNEKPDTMTGNKTQAQRLRGVIYRIWEQKGKPGDSESFYRTYMERIIEREKANLD